MFEDAGLPTVRYFLIFSRRFGPMPRMAVRRLTLLKEPLDLRICRIFSAVDGPIPGTSCNWVESAVLMLTGWVGGFLVAEETANRSKQRLRGRASIRVHMAYILLDYITCFNNTEYDHRR